MSDNFPVDPSQTHLLTEANRLDSESTSKLEASLTEPEKKLYEELKSNTVIRLWNRRKHDTKVANLAFTYCYNTHADMWLAPDDADLKDTFLHELGQANNHVLGYRGAAIKNQADSTMKQIVSFINNAFIGAIAEINLAKRGLDRSYYKTRMIKAVKHYLDTAPAVTESNVRIWKQPLHMSDNVYMYVVNKLILRDAFVPLEELWKAKIRIPETRLLAKNTYKEAIRKEITPARYRELQGILAESLGVQQLILFKKPFS